MILQPATSPAVQNGAPTKTQPFQMVFGQNDRMAGSVPVAGGAAPKTDFAENLAASLTEKSPPSDGPVEVTTLKTDQVGFLDFLDIINPLQHIPVVSMIYRGMTGDTMKPVSEIVGGVLFGGALGAAMSTVSAVIKSETGKDTATALMETASSPSSVVDLGSTIALADLRTGYTPYNV